MLTCVHGAPYAGKTWTCFQSLDARSTRRVSGKPPRVEKKDALRLLAAGEQVLVDDGALSAAAVRELADEARSRFAVPSLQLLAVHSLGGELQSHWQREWAAAEGLAYGPEPGLACPHALATPRVQRPEGATTADIEAWFKRPPPAPTREQVGVDVVSHERVGPFWTAPHAPARPGLFVDPDAILEVRRGAGASGPRAGGIEAAAAWARRHPDGRVVAIADLAALLPRILSDAPSSADPSAPARGELLRLLAEAAERVGVPLHLAGLESCTPPDSASPGSSADFARPPRPGLFAFAQYRHCLSLRHCTLLSPPGPLSPASAHLISAAVAAGVPSVEAVALAAGDPPAAGRPPPPAFLDALRPVPAPVAPPPCDEETVRPGAIRGVGALERHMSRLHVTVGPFRPRPSSPDSYPDPHPFFAPPPVPRVPLAPPADEEAPDDAVPPLSAEGIASAMGPGVDWERVRPILGGGKLVGVQRRGLVVEARCQGSGSESYDVQITFADSRLGGLGILRVARCSCPAFAHARGSEVGKDGAPGSPVKACKHVHALLCHLFNESKGRPARDVAALREFAGARQAPAAPPSPRGPTAVAPPSPHGPRALAAPPSPRPRAAPSFAAPPAAPPPASAPPVIVLDDEGPPPATQPAATQAAPAGQRGRILPAWMLASAAGKGPKRPRAAAATAAAAAAADGAAGEEPSKPKKPRARKADPTDPKGGARPRAPRRQRGAVAAPDSGSDVEEVDATEEDLLAAAEAIAAAGEQKQPKARARPAARRARRPPSPPRQEGEDEVDVEEVLAAANRLAEESAEPAAAPAPAPAPPPPPPPPPRAPSSAALAAGRLRAAKASLELEEDEALGASLGLGPATPRQDPAAVVSLELRDEDGDGFGGGGAAFPPAPPPAPAPGPAPPPPPPPPPVPAAEDLVGLFLSASRRRRPEAEPAPVPVPAPPPPAPPVSSVGRWAAAAAAAPPPPSPSDPVAALARESGKGVVSLRERLAATRAAAGGGPPPPPPPPPAS